MFNIFQTFLLGLSFTLFTAVASGAIIGYVLLAIKFPYELIPIGILVFIYVSGLLVKRDLESKK